MSIALAYAADRRSERPSVALRTTLRRAYREILVYCSVPTNWARALDYALLLAPPGEAKLTRFRAGMCGLAGGGALPTLDDIAHYAAWADVIVRDHPGSAADLYDWVVGSGRPCIVLPANGRTATSPRRIAIAWNGSLEAARALHAAMPLLRAADEVVLLDSHLYRCDQHSPVIDVGTYLAMQGVAVTRVEDGSASIKPARATLTTADELHVDLLVLGAFRHHRFNGRDVGETLQHAICAGDVPLFLVH